METQKTINELDDSFVMTIGDLVASLTDSSYDNPNAQVFYRTPDGQLHPVGITLRKKQFNTVVELTDIGTAKKLLGVIND